MKNLQNLHLSMIYGDIMIYVVVFVIIFFAALTLGVVLVYLYIKAVAKLLEWLDKKLDK